MRHYTRDEKLKAVQLYIKYDKSPAAVRYELGYPTRNCLYRWYQEYIEHNNSFPEEKVRRSKYTLEQRKAAIDYYLTHGKSISGTIRALGYPGKSALCEWLNEDLADSDRKWFCKRNSSVVRCSQEQKDRAIIAYCSGEKTPKQISEEYGISPYTIYGWKKKMLGQKETMKKVLASNKSTKTMNDLKDEVEQLRQEAELLKKQVYRLQLEKAVLEKTAEIIKKEPGIDWNSLSNREKAIVINALRDQYQLKELLDIVHMAKSTYCYQASSMQKDKYQSVRRVIISLFKDAKGRYGYRRIHVSLKNMGIIISEKIVRRIMSEENLVVSKITRQKYSSYQGEISPEVDNIIERDFHADKPNKKWLTDITEFHIPAGKVYLSPIIDCFDGLPVSWTIGTAPNAELVNSMLDEAILSLKDEEHPIIHSDRGAHYRWPGWIERMERAGLTRSMSKKGCSPDNSACEGFFGRLKNEMFYGHSWENITIEQFIDEVNEYIIWYAEKRIKLSLGGLSPLQYRQSLGLSVQNKKGA